MFEIEVGFELTFLPSFIFAILGLGPLSLHWWQGGKFELCAPEMKL